MKSKKYIIMCVGYTHTGKTTFAKKLVKDVPDMVLLDGDEVAYFINDKYPQAVFSKYSKSKKESLKFIIVQSIFKFCLRAGLNMILSSGHGHKKNRVFIKKMAKKYGYELITIYFNLPRNLIMERIKKTKKDMKIFVWSKNWLQALERQDSYVEYPPSKRNTIYFEIKNDSDYKKVFSEVRKIVKNKHIS